MRLARASLGALLLVALGCAGAWDRLREWERQNAVAGARDAVARGDCEAALERIERAQAIPDPGPFAAESLRLRALCLERLGRREEALAHWRLLRDQHPDAVVPEDPAGLAMLPREGAQRSGVPLPRPRYSESARRSGLTGTVVVVYRVDAQAVVRDIRVVSPAHPMLAAFAIEAVARIEPDAELRRALPFFSSASFRFARRGAPEGAAEPTIPPGEPDDSRD